MAIMLEKGQFLQQGWADVERGVTPSHGGPCDQSITAASPGGA